MTSRSDLSFPASPMSAETTASAAVRAPVQPVPVAQAYPGAFKPLSREDVAGVLGISIRTLENWVKQGRLPAPASIAGRRYWHPERFYAALNAMLESGSDDSPSSPLEVPAPARTPKVPLSFAGQKARNSSRDLTQAMLLQAAA